MRSKTFLSFIFGILGCLLITEWALSATENADTKETLYVTIPPVKNTIQRLMKKEKGEIVVLLQEGQNPHHFEVTPKMALALSKSKAFFTVGLPIENNILKRINPAKQIALDETIIKIKLTEDDSNHHNGHDHGVYDPHIWTSYENLILIAKKVSTALIEIFPQDKESILVKEKEYIAKVKSDQKKAKGLLKHCENKVFFTTHSSLLYFSKEFKLIERALEEEGKSASPSRLEKFFNDIRKDKAKLFLYRENLDDLIKDKISEKLKIYIYPFNPLAEDPLANLNQLVKIFSENC